MDGLQARWDERSPQQWLEDAARYQKMAERFHHHPELKASFAALARDAGKRADDLSLGADLDYFRNRFASERSAAANASDIRVRQVHLEMAERYQANIRVAEAHRRADGRHAS
jgi:hypothetical protein